MAEKLNTPELDGSLSDLRAELKAYPSDIEHFVSDSALFGLALDVLEHSVAVQVLRNSEVPRAAFANARAAFEAGQDMLYLTSDAALYDEYGCLARMHELFENKRLQQRFNRANTESGLTSQEEQDVLDVVKADAEAWDTVAPGCGGKLLRAYDAFVIRKGPARKHWTGLTRDAIGTAVALQLGAPPGVGEIYDAMYGTLSSQSHPRMRIDQRHLEEVSESGLVVSAKATDKDAPASAAAYACVSALASLRRRRQFEFPTPPNSAQLATGP